MTKAAKKRSKLIIIFSVILAIIAVGGIAITFLMNYNTFSPSAPTILDDGQNVYISTTMNDNYKGYRFKFVDEDDNEIVIDSKINQIHVDDLLQKDIQLGKTYKISTCYLAENVGNNTEYSKTVTWKCQTYLDMPTVSYNAFSFMLNWNEVDGADYYRIYINDREDYIQTTESSYDLKLLEGGEKTIEVVGYSNNENFLTSNKSNTIKFTLNHYLQPFNSIDFDSETKIITAIAPSKYEKIVIYLDDREIEFNVNDSIISENQVEEEIEYTYTIDITTIYNGEETIGISPCTVGYYIYDGSPTYYLPEMTE